MSSPFEDITDQQDAAAVELSDNVARDYVRYHRGEVVGHEEEGLLMYLSMLTGWTADENCHNNVIGMGPPGSGKSLTKNTVEELFDSRDTYTKTDATSNAILDSLQWDMALIAPMDEYDKINRDIIEVLKSSNPEDGGYAKDRNVEDPDAQGGYSPVEVSAEANPWVLLYAPSSKKGGIDDELQDRALIIYFSNDKNTRRSIGRKEFGHDHINSSQYDEEYIYDVHELAAALREHHRNLPTQRVYEEDEESDEQQLAGRRGDMPTYVPRWVWYSVEPIFNIDEDHTNRVYGLVSNAVQSSAVDNHHNRSRTTIDVYIDEDSAETAQREAVVVAPQDVANVMCCLPTLLSTTHQLTPLKRHILDAVEHTVPLTDDDGTTVQDVRGWLNENDIPHPSEGTLRQKMNDLAENYYLQKWENAGGKRGKAHIYELRDQGALQTPRVYDLQRHADRDGIDLTAEDCVDIDPSDPFDGCTDPIRDQSFTQTVSDFEAKFSGETVDEPDTDAASFMGPADDSDDTGSDDEPAQASLSSVEEDGVTEGGADPSSTPDPKGQPDDPTEQFVYERVSERDGETLPTDVDVTHLIGAVEDSSHATDVDMSGTAVDPDHDLWQSRPDLTDDRVLTEADALQELSDAYSRLRAKEIVVEDDSAGPPKMQVLRVATDEL